MDKMDDGQMDDGQNGDGQSGRWTNWIMDKMGNGQNEQ